MDLLTFDDDEENEFYRLSRFYWKEAVRCEEAKAYLAGCVMLGSALETLLILMVNCYSEQAAATGQLPKRNGKGKPLLDWDRCWVHTRRRRAEDCGRLQRTARVR